MGSFLKGLKTTNNSVFLRGPLACSAYLFIDLLFPVIKTPLGVVDELVLVLFDACIHLAI